MYVARMHIFHEQQPPVVNVWQGAGSGHDLLMVSVSAVIEDDVNRADGGEEVGPEALMRLIPNMNLKAMIPPFNRIWIEVDADDSGLLAQIVPPHEQRAAAQYADFNKDYGAVAERCEKTVIDREIAIVFC